MSIFSILFYPARNSRVSFAHKTEAVIRLLKLMKKTDENG